MTSLVWVSLGVMPALIWRVLIWPGPVRVAGLAGLAGMRRRAGFTLALWRAGTLWRRGMIRALTSRSSTDPRASGKKGFR